MSERLVNGNKSSLQILRVSHVRGNNAEGNTALPKKYEGVNGVLQFPCLALVVQQQAENVAKLCLP